MPITQESPADQAALPTAGRGKVDVIGIGVQKAATSWLFRCLVEHPDLRPADVRGLGLAPGAQGTEKELNFFNHYYERGHGWYDRLFEFGPWRTIEYSVLYFHDRNVPARIHRYNPDARLLLALRNPIDRALSHHRHEVRQGRLPADMHDFWRALACNPTYIEIGMYATHLSRWLDYFDVRQIHIVDHDDIRTQPSRVIHDALRFIGVDADFTPRALGQWINDGHASRSRQVQRGLRHLSGGIRSQFGDPVWRTLKATRLPTLIRTLNRVDRRPVHLQPLTKEDRAGLAALFEDENARLSDLLGRDFTHWR